MSERIPHQSSDSQPKSAWWKALTLALVVSSANWLFWSYEHRPRQYEKVEGKLHGMAYAPFRRGQSPLTGVFPSEAEVREDLALLSQYTTAIRTYTSGANATIPGIAAEFGLKVNAGAWLDHDHNNNRAELDALVAAAQRYPNIDSAIVANEAVLRGDLSLPALIVYLDEARARLDIPVSTAENWDLWLAHPELAEHVDYIAAHLLPYWEGVPRRHGLARALERLNQLREKFPGKRIVIGEVGWPSAGERFQDAEPSNATQAKFVRQFANRAAELKVEYFLMEAIDQPWKAKEGRVGAYWGMFDAARQPKWTLTGPVREDDSWALKALLACLLAVGPIVLFARRFGRFFWWGRLFFATLIQSASSLIVWLVGVPIQFYLSALDWSMFLLLLPAQLMIVGILLIGGFELTEAIAQKHWLRRFGLRPLALDAAEPMVSIHLPCHNEPPDMVILTLNSLAALEYQNFEVLVIDNNTVDPAVWQPVQAHCAQLGAHFKFFHLRPWPGFKAGALNYALQQTDPSAKIIAVVDSDYEVRSDWLRALVSYFDDPKVAVVQCPQAHRDYAGNAFRRICNFEYEGFFRIGMHHRNERNAIIQHGTMTMVKADALREVGGWAEWCICEDAELGLKLMNAGYQTNYVDEVMGRGLTPADFTAYKSQRFRWAFGAMQILRAHWGKMTGASGLDFGQRFHFLTGWFEWFAAALHLVFTVMALLWTVGMLLKREVFAMPLELFLIPVLGFCMLKAVYGVVLYRTKVPCSWRDCLGASLASMALSHTIARGVLKGLTSSSHPFERTAKSRRLRAKPNAFSAVREEGFLTLALLAAIVGVASNIGAGEREAQLWIAILIAQALPYVSALVAAWIAARSGERLSRVKGASAEFAEA